MSDWAPDIFEYLNYRDYLTQWYEAGRQHTSVVSYRYLARRAGFSSPSYLRHVMRGERNLGAESIDKLAEALDLNATESKYLRALVDFDQADAPETQNEAFDQVAAIRRFKQARRLGDDLFDYLSHWYYPAIREMAARDDFRDDAAWVAGQLLPTIKPAQAREALDTLFSLGLLVRGEEGTITRGETSVSTEHEVHNLAVGNYHRQMLERAADSIETVPSELRDIAAMTVCISPDTIADLKKRVHSFRELLLELCDSDPESRVVFQINTQLFPLSQLPPTEKEGEP